MRRDPTCPDLTQPDPIEPGLPGVQTVAGSVESHHKVFYSDTIVPDSSPVVSERVAINRGLTSLQPKTRDVDYMLETMIIAGQGCCVITHMCKHEKNILTLYA
jgi:hypothetical protein